MKMDEVFEVVMNHYRAGGGGGYWMFKNKPVIREIHKDMCKGRSECKLEGYSQFSFIAVQKLTQEASFLIIMLNLR
ncbi:Uncharacterised protein [Mycobacteroides abscessus subsp. abscessus]|nr:Uncharacterised protein [Mycobacteroides abscessus subsp. abscessus]